MVHGFFHGEVGWVVYVLFEGFHGLARLWLVVFECFDSFEDVLGCWWEWGAVVVFELCFGGLVEVVDGVLWGCGWFGVEVLFEVAYGLGGVFVGCFDEVEGFCEYVSECA